MSFKGFLQTTWCLSLVQYPPHARYGGAPGRRGHPARAGAAVGALAATVCALDPRPGCAARQPGAGGLDRLVRPHRPGPDPELSSLDIGSAEPLHPSLPAAPAEPPRRKRQSALVDGFSLHAGVHLHANDREGLEKLCGYGARPPFALERLSVLPDGRVCYRLKRPTADERTELRLAPTEFLRKLASLIPPLRHHLVRFHGVFAPNAAWRKEVVPS